MITGILLMQVLLSTGSIPVEGRTRPVKSPPRSSKASYGKVDKNPLKHDFR
jgi:hypothetical protein